MKTRAFLFGTLASLALLAGCEGKNYAGEGNDFTLVGQITDVGKRSVQIKPNDVANTHGKATKWFHEGGETQIHNNYKDEDCNIHTVETDIYDKYGHPEALDKLKTGEWVEVSGRIRESKESCGDNPSWDYRPVYKEVHEILR